LLRLIRALGFLAPLAVTLCVGVLMTAAPGFTESQHLPGTVVVLLAAAAGMTTMALVGWSYFAWRLNRIAAALEATIGAQAPAPLREVGVPAERRLARAFNAAVRTFLQVEVRATRDRLTGVANRETLLTTLLAEVERAIRHYKPLSVAFIDIDRFKPINDTYGHNSGDAVLRQIAALGVDNIRPSDLFGRYGGEEFMLILPETTPEQAVELAERLRLLVARAQLVIANQQSIGATISIGVAGGRGSELQVDTLVDRADAAMYAAKSLGRNRTYLFRELDETAPVRRAPISADRRAAASAIGQWANDTATQALASVLAPQPHHRGRPSDMIAALACGMALEMGLPPEEIGRVRIAALLHDLGKLAVDPDILDKPSTLADHEWQAIGEHPRIGQVILEQASALREAIPVVLHHHERYNGTGYPHGLHGNEIPLGARIVSVADAYHAMVHDRPYKSRRTHAEALDELRRCAGTQFDPDVVEVFCDLYAEAVPGDGLEEVHRLLERARGGVRQIDPHAAAATLGIGQRDGDAAPGGDETDEDEDEDGHDGVRRPRRAASRRSARAGGSRRPAEVAPISLTERARGGRGGPGAAVREASG
jgi:diguanylate cyclase (GGDEF)-like protein